MGRLAIVFNPTQTHWLRQQEKMIWGLKITRDISVPDEKSNPKNGPVEQFFKNSLVSCQGEFISGEKLGGRKYFLNNGQLKSSGNYKDGKISDR